MESRRDFFEQLTSPLKKTQKQHRKHIDTSCLRVDTVDTVPGGVIGIYWNEQKLGVPELLSAAYCWVDSVPSEECVLPMRCSVSYGYKSCPTVEITQG